MRARLDWARDGADWPHRCASRFVSVGARTMHVQTFGSGPLIALLHGAGASVHTWRGLAPLLAERHRVIAMDLPGHGFSTGHSAQDLSLPGMARTVAALFETLGESPRYMIGHSAGGAVAVRLALDGLAAPHAIIGLNAALLPFAGAAGRLFPGIARALFFNPFAASLAAASATPRSVARLIASTGSTLDAEGVALYARLLRSADHVQGVMGMMAHWDLDALRAELAGLACQLVLVVAAGDKAVPSAQARQVCRLVRSCRIVPEPGLGHLAHEEAPERIARTITAELAREDAAPGAPIPEEGDPLAEAPPG